METESATPEAPQKIVPPYFAFKTLQNMLEDMKKRAIPNRIDRTFLVGMSGAGQTQFITGLRSLGLIDASGNVQPELEAMVQGSSEERRRILREVLQKRYPEAVELGKTNATTGQLVEVFREHYGAHGDTARKAIAFYLQAAKFAGGIPLSPLFQTPKVSSSAGTTRKRRKPAGAGTNGNEGNGGKEGDETVQRSSKIPEFHPILEGVLSEFPAKGKGWTQTRRDDVVKMLEMAIAFTIPIVDEDEVEDDDLEEEDEETADDLQE